MPQLINPVTKVHFSSFHVWQLNKVALSTGMRVLYGDIVVTPLVKHQGVQLLDVYEETMFNFVRKVFQSDYHFSFPLE